MRVHLLKLELSGSLSTVKHQYAVECFYKLPAASDPLIFKGLVIDMKSMFFLIHSIR